MDDTSADPLSRYELEELEIRVEIAWRDRIRDQFFDKQADAYWSKAPQKAIKTPRRSGKTWTLLGTACDKATRAGQQEPPLLYPYIAKTQKSARYIAWPLLRTINREYELDIDFKGGTLEAVLPNGNIILVAGADREDLHGMFLGGGVAIGDFFVDECPAWRSDLRRFHREVLDPLTLDRGGTAWLAGCPFESDRNSGYFFDITQPEKRLREPDWDYHEWTVEDNPYMVENFRKRCERWERAYGKNFRQMPWFQRQWLGLWVLDHRDMVVPFERDRNALMSEDGKLEAPWTQDKTDRYVLGMDTGFTDGMAYVVMGYNPQKHSNLVVYESTWKVKQGMDEIASMLESYRDRYPGIRIVGDYNNAQLLHDLNTRYKIPVYHAEKTDKMAWVRILGTHFERQREFGNILVVDPDVANADLTDDLEQMRKRYLPGTTVTTKEDGTREIVGTGAWEIDPTSAPGHCFHALMYGFRECYPYLYKPPKIAPAIGSPEYYREIEKQWIEKKKKKHLGSRQAGRRRRWQR